MRVVIEREEHIDRPGADRQRRHQAADQRTGALGGHRRRQHEAGGDGHFDDEDEREIKVGRHCILFLAPRRGHINRPAGVSTTRPVTLPARS